MKRSSWGSDWIFNAFIASLLTLFLVVPAELVGGVGRWYSSHPLFSAQVDAFLQGNLQLSDRPVGALFDMAFANGLQQIWGLGIPLSILPFEILGRVFNDSPVPINLIFTIFLWLVIVQGLFTFPLLLPASFSPTLKKLFAAFGATLFFMSGFVFLLSVHFGAYAQPIAFGALAVLSLLFLFLEHLIDPTLRSGVWIGGFCGFLPWVRPTLLLTGLSTFLLFLFVNRKRRRELLAGSLAFSLGLLVLVGLNYWRFGAPFEFGHSMSLTSEYSSLYYSRFGKPFILSDFLMSLWQYFVLFFTGNQISDNPLNPHYFEIRYLPFGWVELVLMVLALLGWGFWGKRTSKLSGGKNLSGYLLIWSVFSFLPLFVFYSTFESFIDRYFFDLLPSVYGMILSLVLLLLWNFHKRTKLVAGVLTLALAVMFFRGYTLLPIAEQLRKNEGRANSLTWLEAFQQVRYLKNEFNSNPDLKAPTKYVCKSAQGSQNLPYNTIGWEVRESCKVGPVTQFYLAPSDCVLVQVEYDSIEGSKSLGSPLMSATGKNWKLTKSRAEENQTHYTFCRANSRRLSEWGELITLALAPPKFLKTKVLPGVLLKSVEIVPPNS